MATMKCDLCEANATVFVTQIRNGVPQKQKFCDAHTGAVTSPELRAQLDKSMHRSQLLATFIAMHRRLPTVDECRELDLPHISLPSDGDQHLTAKFLEALLKGVDEHGRIPSELDTNLDENRPG